MKTNTFILTTGLSGSSVVTGLLQQAKFWCGEETEYKNNSTGQYETFENSKFVALNDQLVSEFGTSFQSKSWYDLTLRDKFTHLLKTQKLNEYKNFVDNCAVHEPWVLKDPKLWITLGFWIELFKDQEFNVIVLSRDVKQLWLSQTNKRIIYDYQYLKNSEEQSKQQLMNFLNKNQISFIELVYDDLVQHTEKNIDKINHFLGTSLTLNDWNCIYKKKQSNSQLVSAIKAVLIYIKNYSSRIR